MIKFIKTEGSLHTFEIYENDTLKERATVGGATKEEAQSLLENRPIPNEVEIEKRELINQVKRKAKELLSNTDYKITRHEEQLKIEAETTLTDIEFQTLLTGRNNIRINSNVFESEIENLTTIEQLKSYKIEY